MNSLNTFKKWTESKPYFWFFVMAFVFVFFLAFNFGLDSYKRTRGLASNEDVLMDQKLSKVVAENMSSVIEGRPVQHGSKPSPQEQFLYGYLQGKYKAFYVENNFSHLELKENHQPIEFSKNRREELMRNFQALFVSPGTTLENMKTLREPASKEFSYEMRLKGDLKGRFQMIFNIDNELQAIKVSDLSL